LNFCLSTYLPADLRWFLSIDGTLDNGPELEEVVDYVVRREALRNLVEGLFPAVYGLYEQRYLLVLEIGGGLCARREILHGG